MARLTGSSGSSRMLFYGCGQLLDAKDIVFYELESDTHLIPKPTASQLNVPTQAPVHDISKPKDFSWGFIIIYHIFTKSISNVSNVSNVFPTLPSHSGLY